MCFSFWRVVSTIAQTMTTNASMVWEWSELSNSLEAIANLLYLIGKSPDNPAAVSIYVGLAEDRMRVIAARYGPDSSPERALATCPASLPLMSFKSHNPSSDEMN